MKILHPLPDIKADPLIVCAKSSASLIKQMAQDIEAYLAQGYESIAVIGKSQREATEIYHRLMKYIKVNLVTANDIALNKGVIAVPVYMAKGLEFDTVLVYQASAENYSSELDRKLLYVPCTRALHRLSQYHTGELSDFLNFQ